MMGLSGVIEQCPQDLAYGRTSLPAHSHFGSVRGIIDEITSLSRLERDWDSYGARPIDLRAIRAALTFVQAAAGVRLPGAQVVPTPSGGVQLEWNTSAAELEIEFEPSGTVVFVFDDFTTGKEVDGEVPGNHELLLEALSKLSTYAWQT